MYRLLLCCLLFACAYAQTENIESLIAKIFNSTESTTQAPTSTISIPYGRMKLKRCIKRDKGHGVCLPQYQCNEDGSVNTDGFGNFDERREGEKWVLRRRRWSSGRQVGFKSDIPRSTQGTPTANASANDSTDDVDYERGRPLDL
ncbi:hypothetical protein EVAR_18603_1 [Eumeta japonica]|uniref:Uncharacterized protein n=1 Tax=Eumeta variegata TaxID=151549 RepID=A0A4C1V4B9_EUMVA|nr:hypothetical protein EVAR_18603_1 [Eumeta japonica]